MTSAVAAASSATRVHPETAAAATAAREAAKGTNPEDRSCHAPVVVTTTNWKSSTNTIQSRRHLHHGPNQLLHHTCDAVKNSHYCHHHHPHLDVPSLNPQSTSAHPQISETSITSSSNSNSAGCPAAPSPPNSNSSNNSNAITKVVTVREALPPAAIQCTSTCTAGATETAAMAAAEAATTGTTRQDVGAEGEVVVSASGKRRHQFQSHLLFPSALLFFVSSLSPRAASVEGVVTFSFVLIDFPAFPLGLRFLFFSFFHLIRFRCLYYLLV